MVALNHHENSPLSHRTTTQSQAVSAHRHGEASEAHTAKMRTGITSILRRAGLASIVAVAGFSTLAVSSVAVAVPQESDIELAKTQENNTQVAINELQQQIDQVNEQIKQARLNRSVAEMQYADAMSKLVVSQEAEKEAQKTADTAQSKVEKKRRELGSVARSVYTSQGSLSAITPYLSKKGVSVKKARALTLQRVGNQTEKKLSQFSADKERADKAVKEAQKKVQESKAHAQETKERLDNYTAVSQDVEKNIQTLSAQKDALVAQLAQQRGVTQQLQAELQAERERQQAEAEAEKQRQAMAEAAEKARIEAEKQAQAEAEAKARKEAEEREQAEKERQAQEQANAEQSAPQPAPAPEPEPAPQPEPQPQPAPAPAPSQGAQQRAAVAEYAKQFVGYSYVWGTAGPNTFDCSGLVVYAYRNVAGISLPHNDRMQANAGRIISESEAQPGDLVWYPSGHIGIYLGGGMLVHAANPSEGVIITQAAPFGPHYFVRVTND